MADLAAQIFDADEWKELTGVAGKNWHWQNTGSRAVRIMITDGDEPVDTRQGEIVAPGEWTKQGVSVDAAEKAYVYGRASIFLREIV